MKKVENVNIGGSPFLIDEDAYVKLNQYIDTIVKHFSQSEGSDEIIEDIEFRLAELFSEQIKPRKIISLKDFNRIVEIMGTPADFGAENDFFDQTAAETKNHSHAEHSGGKRKSKRLFRDEEDKVIGGVCSGLSQYFGLEEPLIMRLIFGALFFGFGFGLIPYIVLWILVPEAKTSSDRLAMAGEPINIDSIAKQVEEEIKNLTDKVQDLGKNFGKKK